MTWKPVSLGNYEYPEAANIAGWCLAAVPFAPIPIVFVYVLATTKGDTVLEVSYSMLNVTASDRY